jgi:hypothetical protein
MTKTFLSSSAFLPDSYETAREILINELSSIKQHTNRKTSGEYLAFETLTNQTLSRGSQNSSEIFRIMVDFGALPNATQKTVPHGIDFTTSTRFVKIYGTATDPFGLVAFPIPYSTPASLSEAIELWIDDTNVIIETDVDYSDFTECLIILEYIKFERS